MDLRGIDLASLVNSVEGPRDIRGEDEDYRMLVVDLDDGTFLVTGRSLSSKQHQLETLTTVTILGGGVAILAALVSGWWLAGRTLGPIRAVLESQRRFVSDASHELRTPLAIARANTSLLLEDPEATVESRLDQAEAVASELEHLGVLVADLTTLARADEGRGNLLLAPMDLGALADEVVRDMSALADVRGTRLESTISPSSMQGDTVRLRQLLMILVDNALKYAAPGGIVRVRCQPQGGHVELEVSDDGAGISEADQKHIFDRFYRSDSERTRSKGGTGLGLAIGKWIVEAHGGRITVESAPGKGTTFRVRLASK
ncbi:MAG: HAMP domain-containing histidine kinase [Dehalococcoidia bacterium]|nr:HAMP domain-containing histidine kinase [Dehalococcoidia bacterium]